MMLLMAGLVIFLGTHSVRVVAEPWRLKQIAHFGEKPWKAVYSLLALAGFAMLVWGYGEARSTPVVLWVPPVWTRHVAGLLMLPAMILLVAGNLTGSRIKAKLGHPMVLSVKVWAIAHLLANGNLADVVLFGSFLLWAVLDFTAARRRDRVNAVQRTGTLKADLIAVAVGVALYVLFVVWAHAWLFSVRPFG